MAPGVLLRSLHRWGQPGQQQGLRIPSFSSEQTLSTCCLLVSGFLTERTQQIHSLRASGVISSHFIRAAASETRALRKSAGTLWTTPAESFLVMSLLYARCLTAAELQLGWASSHAGAPCDCPKLVRAKHRCAATWDLSHKDAMRISPRSLMLNPTLAYPHHTGEPRWLLILPALRTMPCKRAGQTPPACRREPGARGRRCISLQVPRPFLCCFGEGFFHASPAHPRRKTHRAPDARTCRHGRGLGSGERT